ncbi:hypothetical protein AVDCRST_MAG84-7146 [uncultured Microcoleus sp.]|uniref:Uncharacterized protein n=1 Tax=uncultured Microcoleus sp. TaxID=259945 RepID=A0A6J4PSQ9_9CYAN|nr:hypothetical protein AVDCRST_MAG84-7146 [uncultured Microcoleus sp.]
MRMRDAGESAAIALICIWGGISLSDLPVLLKYRFGCGAKFKNAFSVNLFF